MTLQTNLEPKGELHVAGQKLLDAAMEYWEAYREETGGSAVVWLTDTDGRMIVLTRGEYRDTLLSNVNRLAREHEMVRSYQPSEEWKATVRDAERYQHLRETFGYSGWSTHRLEWFLPYTGDKVSKAEQLDTSIDDAIARKS